jgi:hypothetical protein
MKISMSYYNLPIDYIKYYFVILLSTILPLFISDFSLAMEKQNITTFIDIFGGEQNDRGIRVLKTKDNGFLALGNTKSIGNGEQDIYLLKIDKRGKKQWDKTIGGPYNDEGLCLSRTKDFGFIISGQLGTANDSLSSIIIRLNSNCNIVWSRIFNDQKVYSIIQTNDFGYFMGGVSFDGNNYNSFLKKVNFEFEEEWLEMYNNFSLFTCVQETSDGGFASLSFEKMLKVDRKGQVVQINTYEAGTEDEIHAIENTIDGGLILAGSNHCSYDSACSRLIHTDCNGNTLWEYHSGMFGVGNSVMAMKLEEFYVCDLGYFYKTKGNSGMVWHRHYTWKGHQIWPFSFDSTEDGGFILTGFVRIDEYNDDIFIMKVDNLGNCMNCN